MHCGLDGTVMDRPDPVASGAGTPNGKKYFIHTFGCQMNLADSERMAGVLSAVVAEHAEGTLPDDGSEADLARDGHVQDAWPE